MFPTGKYYHILKQGSSSWAEIDYMKKPTSKSKIDSRRYGMRISVDEGIELGLTKAQIWKIMCRNARELGLGWLIHEDSCAIDLREDQKQGGGNQKS